MALEHDNKKFLARHEIWVVHPCIRDTISLKSLRNSTLNRAIFNFQYSILSLLQQIKTQKYCYEDIHFINAEGGTLLYDRLGLN